MDGFKFPPPPPPAPPPAHPLSLSSSTSQSPHQDGEVQNGPARDPSRWSNSSERTTSLTHHGASSSDWRRDQIARNVARPAVQGSARSNFGNGDIHGNLRSGPYVTTYARLPAGSHVNTQFQHNALSGQHSMPQAIIAGRAGVHQGSWQSKRHDEQPSHTHSVNKVSGTKRKRNPSHEQFLFSSDAGNKPPSSHVLPAATADDRSLPSTQRTQRTGAALGLTPQTDTYQFSSSEGEQEDDVDEEAKFAELGANLTFEHDGVIVSLNTSADIANWRKDRAKNFPTKDRIATKLAQLQKMGEERRALLRQANEMLNRATQPKHKSRRNTSVPHDGLQALQKPRKNETGVKDQSSTHVASLSESRDDDAIDYTGTILATDQNNSASESRSQVQIRTTPSCSQSQDNELCTEDTALRSLQADAAHDNDSGSDSGPEQVSSKIPEAKTRSMAKTICRYWSASGHCRNRNSCHYDHSPLMRGMARPVHDSTGDQEPDSNNSRKSSRPQIDGTSTRVSIHDRLIEQEQKEEHILALQVIKYLGKASMFSSQDANEP